MAGEWRITTLGQITDFLSGGTPSKDVAKFLSGTIPWVSAKDMKRFCLNDTEDHVSEEGVANGTKLIPRDTVLLLARGMTLLNDVPICVAKQPMTFNQDVKALRPKSGVRNEFLPYLFLGNKRRLLNLVDLAGHGTGRLNSDELKALEVVLPPEPEQDAIAHILGTLDDKIELNRRMNETLEAMARALFKSWFIDFDPMRRNMARKAGQNQPSPAASRHPLPEGEAQYRGGYDFAGLVKVARDLRKRQTPAEGIFWELVRDRRLCGLKFRRQHQLGNYVTDFYCHERRLVIEFDGGIHRKKQAKDHKRDAWMVAQGFKVIRFPNVQLLDDPESVLSAIADAVLPSLPGRGAGDEGSVEASLPPLPLGEGRGEGSVEELDRLFPDSFEDSELGKIPKGWEVGKLGDVICQRFERCVPSAETVARPYVPIDCISSKSLFLNGSRPGGEANSSLIKFYKRDLLFGAMRPYFHKVCIAPFDGTTRTTAFVLSPRQTDDFAFATLLLHHPDTINFATRHSTGSTIPYAVWTGSLEDMPVLVPPIQVRRAFNNIVCSLLIRIPEPYFENRSLAALRDTLLPKLISGELRVNDAKKVVEASI